MKRRDVLRTAVALGATASLSPPAVFAQSARERTLRVAPLTALSSVDTVFNTSLVTTNHGYAAYDTLFGFTGKREITPQMAEGHF